jgi:hypothetical protein
MKFQTRFFLCYLLPRLLQLIVNQLEKEAKETRTPYDDLALELAKLVIPYLPQLLGCKDANNDN